MKTQESKFGYVLEGKVYLKGFLDKSDRQIGEVVEDDQTSTNYFEERFSKIQDKVDELVKTVDTAENKGSFLMKIIHLRESLNTYNALGDFESLYKKLDKLEDGLREQINVNHERNLVQKRTLLVELKTITDAPYLQESVELVKSVQQRWVKTGKVPKSSETEIEEEFKALIQQFFDSRKDYTDAKKQVTEERLAKYQGIIDRAKELVQRADFEKDLDTFKALQKEWKEIGFVPKPSLTELWNAFKEVGDQYFSAYKEFTKKNRKARFKQNNEGKIAQKTALLEKAKALLDLPIQEAVTQTKSLQKEWKAIGYIPKLEKIQYEFYLACDYVFEYQYLLKFVQGKDRKFAERDEAEQNQRLVRGIYTLIERDEDELRRYQENLSFMTIRSNSNSGFDKMVDSRLGALERKIKAKKTILEKLKEK